MPTFKTPMLSILLIYSLLLLVVFLYQRKMIYFAAQYSIEAQQQMADQANLKLWPSTDDYRGLISKTPQTTGKGKLGYRVILAEYPGYAARNGAPSESALISDGIQTAKQALKDFGEPIFLWGESLGGGVVGGIVQSGQVPVKGIVLVTPFNSMADVAQHHYWFFFAKGLIRDKFDNIKNLQTYSGNTAVLLAEQDEIIPGKYSLKLFESLPHRKKLWTFKDAGHNTLPLNQALPWWQEVMQFVNDQNDATIRRQTD